MFPSREDFIIPLRGIKEGESRGKAGRKSRGGRASKDDLDQMAP